jgi:hypothetical protein
MLNKVENINIRKKAFDPLENFEFHINYPPLAMHYKENLPTYDMCRHVYIR